MASTSARPIVGEISIIKTKYKWVIRNFCMGCKNVGDDLRSPVFSTVNSDLKNNWQIGLFPKSDSEQNKDYCSIFLYNLSNTDFMEVDVSFKILNRENRVVMNRIAGKGLFTKNEAWGSNFVEREFIMNPASGVLNDDTLTIVCELGVATNEEKDPEPTKEDVKEKPEKEEYPRVDDSKQNEGDLIRLREYDELESLIDDKDFSDVQLNVKGKATRVHKGILAKRSPVFAAIFEVETKEQELIKVELEDVKPNVFVEVLRYMYASKVNSIENMTGKLLAAADKYALHGLKLMCEKTLCENLSLNSVVRSLSLADRHGLDELKSRAIKFITVHRDGITNLPEFGLLGELCPGVTCEVMHALMQSKKQ